MCLRIPWPKWCGLRWKRFICEGIRTDKNFCHEDMFVWYRVPKKLEKYVKAGIDCGVPMFSHIVLPGFQLLYIWGLPCQKKKTKPLASRPQTPFGCDHLGCGSVETLASRQELGMDLTKVFFLLKWGCVWKWGTPIELQFWVWWWCQRINYKKSAFTKCQMQAEWCRPEKSGVLSLLS